MGIITRTKMILRMRTSAALDGLENPVQVLTTVSRSSVSS